MRRRFEAAQIIASLIRWLEVSCVRQDSVGDMMAVCNLARTIAVSFVVAPLAVEFAKSPEQRAILELFFTQTIFGRPYVVAPEVPADRVAALRQASYDTLNDPDLKTDANKEGLDVDQVTGDDLQKIVAKVYAAPPDIIAKTKAAVVPKR